MLSIVPVVEGPGDADALPDLLRRILWEKLNRYDAVVAHGKKGIVKTNGRSNLIKKLEKFLQYAQRKPRCGAILVLVDTDGDCPVELAKELSDRSRGIGIRCPVQIVCANRSFESWFLASFDTIRGHYGISSDARLDMNAEEVPSPKRWITAQMPQGQAYKETIHQGPLCQVMELESTQVNSRSFRRLCHALEQLLDAMV